MVGHRIMAVLAGIIDAATLHLDGKDVKRRVVMSATRLGIQIDSVYMWMWLRHRFIEQEINIFESSFGDRRIKNLTHRKFCC